MLLGGFGPTASGVSVTPQNAMQQPAVYACVRVLAESLESVTPHIYRSLPSGGREAVPNHPLEPLLSDAANPWTPASEFRLQLQTQLSLAGNAYAFVNRNADGEVVEMIALPYGSCSVTQNPTTLELIYTVGNRTYDRSEILHLRGTGMGYVGDSPVTLCREAIGLASAMEAHACGLFGRGARPSGILRYSKTLTTDIVNRLRASWNNAHQGPDASGKTVILEDGMDWQQTQLTSVDSQFLELQVFQLQQIARLFRVPAHLINDLQRITFSNAETLGDVMVNFCLLPIIKCWNDSLRITLLSAADRLAGYYIDFDVDVLKRADTNQRFAAYSSAISSGVLSPNDVRELENRPPYPGGEVFTRPLNSGSVSDVGGVNGAGKV